MEKDILEEKLVLLEIFLINYLEDWSIEQTYIKNRQTSDSSRDNIVELCYKIMDKLFKTREKFLTHQEQAEKCLEAIRENRHYLSGNQYKEKLTQLLEEFDFGVFDQWGLGSRLCNYVSKMAKEVTGLEPVVRRSPKDSGHTVTPSLWAISRQSF